MDLSHYQGLPTIARSALAPAQAGNYLTSILAVRLIFRNEAICNTLSIEDLSALRDATAEIVLAEETRVRKSGAKGVNQRPPSPAGTSPSEGTEPA